MAPEVITALCIIAAGRESGDHRRVDELMGAIGADAEYEFVSRTRGKFSQMRSLVRRIRDFDGDIVLIEGTGITSGFAAILSSYSRRGARGRVKYLISSGDAVDSFFRNRNGHLAGWIAGFYETALYKRSFGFIGWTPYLVGRAIRMGAPRGLTVEGAVPRGFMDDPSPQLSVRDRLGIGQDDVVVGISGSIIWSERQQYAYGLELANAAASISRPDVRFLIVGEGTGLERLKQTAGNDDRFRFTGRLEHEQMRGMLEVMDVAVISQTPDELGLLRLTTKLPEYLAAGVPVAMTLSPGSADYLSGGRTPAVWLLPDLHPASTQYAAAVAAWVRGLNRGDIAQRSASAREVATARFDLEVIAPRLSSWLEAALPGEGGRQR